MIQEEWTFLLLLFVVLEERFEEKVLDGTEGERCLEA
jgi:hypothetical protein